MPMSFSVADRRARLVTQHHLNCTAPDALTAVEALLVLHSSDPATPHLSLWARVHGFQTAALDHALLDSRTLWRLHAMRRTLFIANLSDVAALQAGAGGAVAAKERKRVEKWLSESIDGPVDRYLSAASEAVLTALADGREASTQDLSSEIESLRIKLTVGSGKHTAQVPLSSRLLYLLAMEHHLVRTRPAGSWRSSQYKWARANKWFGERFGDPVATVQEAPGRSALVQRYLESFGPATLTDIKWWTGWTVAKTRAALVDSGAETVQLDPGGEAYVAAGDAGPTDSAASGVALLPGLDPSPMGWKERDWFVGAHAAQVFDRNGNI